MAMSTRTNDTTIDDSTWLIPRKGTGFDNFLKKGKTDLETDEDKNLNEVEGEKGGESESSEDDTNSSANKNKDGDNVDEKKEDGDVFGSFRSNYSDNNTKNNSEG